MQAKKQQLETDVEKRTGSKLGKSTSRLYNVTPLMSLICRVYHAKFQAGLKHKLESSFPGEISITSDMQMTPPFWQKVKRN